MKSQLTLWAADSISLCSFQQDMRPMFPGAGAKE
jgi:hypothetical protein